MKSMIFAAVLVFASTALMDAAEPAKPNLLIVTVDDMSCDSVGVFGCALPDTTPHIDRFAAGALRYEHAHVQTGSCNPSRNVMFSGRYSHNTGVEGFYEVPDASYPHLVDLMQAAGYFVGIRGKVGHSTPYQPYAWDADLTVIDGEAQPAKDPDSYYRSTRRGIELAIEAEKPFCLNINISDPHKPFYATGKRGETVDDPFVPSRVFTADEVPVPGFLFDVPDVRTELAQYYSSVRRADDCFAQVVRALEESGKKDQTVVMFLSDHGMPLPFAKTGIWHHSTRTPWVVSWPGVTRPGTIDQTHMISAVDLLPTVLEIAGSDLPEGLDGRSFRATLRGETQPDRDYVYKFHNENSGRNRSPMRSVQSKQFGYHFNAWPNGQRVFKTATTGTMTFRAMQKLAPGDHQIAARLDLFQHGVPEEFYDYANDPDGRYNLIDDPAYATVIEQHRKAMLDIMKRSGDPMLPAFEARGDRSVASRYVDQVQAESDARSQARRKKSPNRGRTAKKNLDLFDWQFPETARSGEPLTVTIDHRLPKRMGSQRFHVTLKDETGQRITRSVVECSGTGQIKVVFPWPGDPTARAFQFAAFVGDDYPNSLQHRVSGRVAVKNPSKE